MHWDSKSLTEFFSSTLPYEKSVLNVSKTDWMIFWTLVIAPLSELSSKTHSKFNPFLSYVPILYPLKAQENICFSGVFRGGV